MPDEPPTFATHAAAVRCVLPDETVVTIPPVTLAQALRALRLHPLDKGAESTADYFGRIGDELAILGGPALDGITGLLTPCQARDLVARLWVVACGLEPLEPSVLPLRQTPPRPTLPAGELLARYTLLASDLQAEFFPHSQQVGDLALSDALLLSRSIHRTPAGSN